MYTLYYSPGACSKAVHIALVECNTDYKAVAVNLRAPTKNPDLLAANLRYQVPVLKDGDTVVREGAAILTYLLEKQQSPLLPAAGTTNRAQALEWLAWANATLHPAYSMAFCAPRISQDTNVQSQVTAFAQSRINTLWAEAEQHLSQNAYLAGDQLTIADILMTVIAQWNPGFSTTITFGPNTQRVLDAVKARPSWQQVTEVENTSQKQAA